MDQSKLDNSEDAIATSETSGSPKSAKARRRRSPILDFFLGFFGFCLAAFSSYLPFYVYIHSSEFGPPEMEFTGRANSETPPGELEILQGRRPLFREVKQASNGDQGVDAVVTGSIEREEVFDPSPRPAVRSSSELGVLPPTDLDAKTGAIEHKTLTLVFATGNRALIRDGDDLVPVAIGSRLPDGSTVKSLSRKQGGWQLFTSENNVLKLVK